MKIFISQKMRGKTQEEIEKERTVIKEKVVAEKLLDGTYVHEYETLSFVESCKPELAFKDHITSLSQSLAMLAEADIVLVPESSYTNFKLFASMNDYMKDHIQNLELLKGCEFEFLVAKSYGKKVYIYDEAYNFEEV